MQWQDVQMPASRNHKIKKEIFPALFLRLSKLYKAMPIMKKNLENMFEFIIHFNSE